MWITMVPSIKDGVALPVFLPACIDRLIEKGQKASKAVAENTESAGVAT